MSGVSNLIGRTNGLSTKTPVSSLNIVKLYNNGKGGVDIVIQKTAAYRLDSKSKYRVYLRMFFALIDVGLANSHGVYTKLGNDIFVLNFKIVVAKALIGRYSNRKKLFPTSRPSKQKSHEPSMTS